MARIEVFDAPLGEIRGAHSAAGGSAVTSSATTTALVPFLASSTASIGKFGARWVQMKAHNGASSATTVRWLLNPWLTVVRTTDSLLNYTDFSDESQDGDTNTSVTLNDQDTIANGDALYVGSHQLFRGVDIDVDGANSTGSRTLTVRYWNGVAWTDASATDGTSSSTSLDQDGDVTWTVPTDWITAKLNDIERLTNFADQAARGREPFFDDKLYWTRWEWNGALDAAVTLDSMHSLNRSTSYAEIAIGDAFQMYAETGYQGLGCVEHLTDTGTADLIINIAMLEGGKFRAVS